MQPRRTHSTASNPDFDMAGGRFFSEEAKGPGLLSALPGIATDCSRIRAAVVEQRLDVLKGMHHGDKATIVIADQGWDIDLPPTHLMRLPISMRP
jgi:hypothetical protein